MDLFDGFLLFLLFGVIGLPFAMVRLLLATWAEYRFGRRSLATLLFVALLVTWIGVVGGDLVGGGWMSKLIEGNRGGEAVVGFAGLATTLLGGAGIVSDRRRRRATIESTARASGSASGP